LALRASALSPDDRAAIADRVLATIALPALAPLFAPGSRAEVAVAGAIPRDGDAALTFAGRIDRIAVADDVVRIADFKSGTSSASANMHAYVAQLALYRAALAPLYPDRPVRAFLVWLGDAKAVEIAPAELDAALASVTVDSGTASL
jgi:ATP-dependent helicase/nuclease subunit A